MSIKNIWDNAILVQTLVDGGVAVMPTDTIYGMVARAQSESAVNRVYEIRKRAPEKPCIILIGNTLELEKFSVALSKEQKNKLKEYWIDSLKSDGTKELRPTSIILDCANDKFAYLHRGTKTLAFRMPNLQDLRELLLKTGPLIAPSANVEKFPESENIEDAKKYFGSLVDLYIDGGECRSKASKLIRLQKDGSISIIRE